MFTVGMTNMIVKLKNNLEFYITVSNLELDMYISSIKQPRAMLTPVCRR